MITIFWRKKSNKLRSALVSSYTAFVVHNLGTQTKSLLVSGTHIQRAFLLVPDTHIQIPFLLVSGFQIQIALLLVIVSGTHFDWSVVHTTTVSLPSGNLSPGLPLQRPAAGGRLRHLPAAHAHIGQCQWGIIILFRASC